MFFFVLTDDQRYLDKTTVNATVLTDQARQGIFRYLTSGATGVSGGASRRNGAANSTTPSVDFAGQPLTVDPATGAPLFLNSFNVFSDVKDPNRTGIDPIWVGPQYLTRMPLPNNYNVGDGLNTAGFQWLRPEKGVDGATGQSPNTNRNHLTARYDYQIDAKNKVAFTMTREKNWGVTGQTGEPDVPLGAFGDIVRTPYFYTASWTSTLSPRSSMSFAGVKNRIPGSAHRLSTKAAVGMAHPKPLAFRARRRFMTAIRTSAIAFSTSRITCFSAITQYSTLRRHDKR